ncbi:MAG: hypothetical protein H8E38_11475 [SAR324 cluster bacterium]|nr:hypothetical protein [SAR324 cluster bacterium]MBL7034446.1 hypothetical protein [SAR324 cluster bacterium]
MQVVTANELKTKGVNSLEKVLCQDDEAIISVRGKPRYVVMELEHYDRLRGAEIFLAWQEARVDYKKGDYEIVENVGEHIKHLEKELSGEAEMTLDNSPLIANV